MIDDLTIEAGMTVLEIEVGVGFDALLTAGQVGPEGRVIGVDAAPRRVDVARRNAAYRAVENVEFRAGGIDALPVESESIDVLIAHGGSLAEGTDLGEALGEMMRVLKAGGSASFGAAVLTRPLSVDERAELCERVPGLAPVWVLGDFVAAVFLAGFEDVAIPRLSALGREIEGGYCMAPGARPYATISAPMQALAWASFRARKPCG